MKRGIILMVLLISVMMIMNGQQLEKWSYHYNGYSAKYLEADIDIGHTTQLEFGNVIQLSQLVQAFSGTNIVNLCGCVDSS